ncbi:MAG: hypothetical protein JWR39_269 [Devosia sp.]|nr:hypothetical protein [Devosia sp.]
MTKLLASRWSKAAACLAALLVLLAVQLPAIAAGTGEPARSCFSLGDEPVCIAEPTYVADVCSAISRFSRHWQIPEAFFARLIWQESRFDPQAISPAGAQGIAQFMPGTARLRALDNPFDPAQALARSAEYLRFLEQKYGNLGLAAAAYNGGEGRVSRFVAGTSGVAGETRNYVSIITGRPVDYWRNEAPEPVDFTLEPATPFQDSCLDMASAVRMPDLDSTAAAWQPWGVLIAQHNSSDVARSRFESAQAKFSKVLGEEPLLLITVRNPNFGPRLRFSAMVGRPTRAEATALCNRLIAAGGNCIVQKNGS